MKDLVGITHLKEHQKKIILALGLGDELKNQEIMEFGELGLRNNEIGILSYQSGAD